MTSRVSTSLPCPRCRLRCAGAGELRSHLALDHRADRLGLWITAQLVDAPRRDNGCSQSTRCESGKLPAPDGETVEPPWPRADVSCGRPRADRLLVVCLITAAAMLLVLADKPVALAAFVLLLVNSAAHSRRGAGRLEGIRARDAHRPDAR